MNKVNSFIYCFMVLLALSFNNAWAKKAEDAHTVSGIYLDVLRIDACAERKGCVAASGPLQLNLLDLADGKADIVSKVLLPARTKELRLVLGDNNTITVDEESFPLDVPSGKSSGLKLKGQRIFSKEGGLLSGLTLSLDLKKQLVIQAKKVKGKGKNNSVEKVLYSFKLNPVVAVKTAEVEPLTDEVAAVLAMPDEENKITLGENFSLVIPAGAVSTPMVISAKETKYTVEVINEETGEAVAKPALSSNYELSPDGAEFAVPLKITIPYYPDTLPSDVSEYDLAVYLDEEKLPTDINIMPKTATADVGHFTSATVSYSQATGKFIFPFKERDKMWQICQGYNTSISHIGTSIYSFDFAYGSGNLKGTSGCWGDFSGSKGKTVVAPAAGKIVWTEYYDKNIKVTDLTCLKLDDVVANGHGGNIYSVMLGHMKADNNRKVSGSVSQGGTLGILCDADAGECVKDGGYSHVHMSAYTSGNCKDTSVPLGTVFGPGYDFSSDKKWWGTEIPANGSQPTTCPNGNGLYCGSSSLGQNTNYLYDCQNGNYTVKEQCANGCEIMPVGTNDQCKDAPTSCPYGPGLYCGNSSLGQNTNTLYYCQDGNYTVKEQCANGCEIMPPDVDDKCKDGSAASITVTSPTSGDEWRSDERPHIEWTDKDLSGQGHVKIEYSLNGGSSWNTIEESTTNDGGRYWEMCDFHTINTSHAYIRITSVEHPSVTDTSDEFTIDYAAGCQ
jgi:hypothetical protein